jgi:hypothetical protein
VAVLVQLTSALVIPQALAALLAVLRPVLAVGTELIMQLLAELMAVAVVAAALMVAVAVMVLAVLLLLSTQAQHSYLPVVV